MTLEAEALSGLPIFALDVLLRSSTVLAAALLACSLLRRRRPETRAALLGSALFAATVLALSLPWLPRPVTLRAGIESRTDDAIPIVAMDDAQHRGAAAGPTSEPARDEEPATPVREVASANAAPAHAAVAATAARSTASRAAAAPAGESDGLRLGGWLAAVWLLGAVVVAGRAVLGRLAAARSVARATEPDAELARWWGALLRESGVRAPVALRVTGSADGPADSSARAPFVTGLRRPTVVAPADLRARLGEGPARAVLLHELVHVARRDLAKQALLLVPRILLWPNPLVAWAHRRWCEERELATDADVVRRLGRGVDYAAGIVRVLEGGNRPRPRGAMALGLADGGVRSLRRRLDAILDPRGPTTPSLARHASWLLMPAIAFLAPALAPQEQEPRTATITLTEPWPERSVFEGEEAQNAWTDERLRRAGRTFLDGEAILAVNLQRELRRPRPADRVVVQTHPDRAWSDVAAAFAAARAAGVPEKDIELRIDGRREASKARPSTPEEGERARRAIEERAGGERGIRLEGALGLIPLDRDGATAERPLGSGPLALVMTGGTTPAEVERLLARADVEDREVRVHVVARPAPAAPKTVGGEAEPTAAPRAPGAVDSPRAEDAAGSADTPATSPAPAPFVRAEDLPAVSPTALREAIASGVVWLARQQRDDGSWSGPVKGAEDAYTGLALLALIPEAEAARTAAGRDVVRAGVAALVKRQKDDGSFGPSDMGARHHVHVWATLALIAASERKAGPEVRDAVRSALDYTLRAQNPFAGWRYGIRNGESDAALTGWMLEVLLRARAAGFEVPQENVDDGIGFLDRMTDPETGRTGYVSRGSTSVRAIADMEAHPPAMTENLTALALHVRGLADRGARGDAVKKGLGLLRLRLPAWDEDEEEVDPLYWRNGAHATAIWGGAARDVWQRALFAALLSRQERSGDLAGSWPDRGAWSASSGRIGDTALHLMALQALSR